MYYNRDGLWIVACRYIMAWSNFDAATLTAKESSGFCASELAVARVKSESVLDIRVVKQVVK